MFKFAYRLLKSNIKIISSSGINKLTEHGSYQNIRTFTFKSSMVNLQEATRQQVLEFLESFDTVLTDCDGVLWQHDKVIPGSPDTLNHFRKLGKKVFYVTNNSTKVRSEYAKKAQQMGFIASKEEVLCSAYLVAQYLKGIDFRKKVYVMGSKSIGKELNAVGIKHIGIGPDPMKQDYRSMKTTDLDPEVGAVVVSFDEHVNYLKLMKVASYLASRECLFIGTNTDETYPVRGCIVMPAAGVFVRAIEVCCRRKAFVVGKPFDYVQKYLRSMGINPARTLMIGDNCRTDIELGIRCGFKTLLVLSGITSEKDVEKLRNERNMPIPDVFLPKLGDLLCLTTC